MKKYFIPIIFIFSLLTGCATRPINDKIIQADKYDASFNRLAGDANDNKTLVILAFSGGGTRAAAFSYGVLEALNETEAIDYKGEKHNLIEYVDVITGVSGGSFTALAYRMYGDDLFNSYEKNFLKRDVQAELIGQAFNPLNWGDLASDGWGRSEMAANLYDKILFKGATFGDLNKTKGPYTVVSSTDIQTGSRILFTKNEFNVLCTDIENFRISRAAAASSAVPVVLSPLTINNYNGECHFSEPEWAKLFEDQNNPPRPAARTIQRLNEVAKLNAKDNPYLHLVDGGISDNLGLRSVLDVFNLLEALREAGLKTKLDKIENIIVVVVNSVSDPKLTWNKSEDGPNTLSLLIRATGVPIDNYSGEQIDQLKDISSRWKNMNEIKSTPEFKKLSKQNANTPAVKFIESTPNAKIYAINVAFTEEKDPVIREKLNNIPTSFALESEQVDLLRLEAKKIFLNSDDFKRLMKDMDAKVIKEPVGIAEPRKTHY